jgi:hypothetical protein
MDKGIAWFCPEVLEPPTVRSPLLHPGKFDSAAVYLYQPRQRLVSVPSCWDYAFRDHAQNLVIYAPV